MLSPTKHASSGHPAQPQHAAGMPVTDIRLAGSIAWKVPLLLSQFHSLHHVGNSHCASCLVGVLRQGVHVLLCTV